MPKENLTNFNQILKTIYQNKLNFSEFETYFNLLINEFLNNPDDERKGEQLTLALSNATVITYNKVEDEKLNSYYEVINNYIAKKIRKNLEKDGIDLVQKFAALKNRNNSYLMKVTEFCDYYYALNLAMMAKLDSIDFLDIIKTLYDIEVYPPISYDEIIKFNDCQKKLQNMFWNLVEQQTNENKRR